MDKKAQLTIIGSAIILLTVVTITYGFFVSGVSNTDPQTATITTGTMELTFADNDNGVAGQLNFGDSITKLFTLENTGTVEATVDIYWKELINTYLHGSLMYKLEYSTSEDGEKTIAVNNSPVPTSETTLQTELAVQQTIPAEKMYYYTLTITLVNSKTIDQTADLRASFASGFTIESARKHPMLAASDTWYKSSLPRSTFTTINIVDSAEESVIANAEESWPAAVDADSDGTLDNNIMCYVNGTVLTISGDGSGSIMANYNSRYMFNNSADRMNGFSNVTIINGAEIIDTSFVTTLAQAFQGCFKLDTVNVSNWNISNVTSLVGMFQAATSISYIDVSKWNTSNVTDFEAFLNMPQDYINESLTELNVSNWDTSSATKMSTMFAKCKRLTTLDVTNWDTSNVTTMYAMFQHCINISTLNVSNWDIGKVTNMSGLFYNCISLDELDLTKWDVSKVEDMSYMFAAYSEDGTARMSLTTIGNVSNWDTSSVTTMYYMFSNCTALTNIIGIENWTVNSTVNTTSMFHNVNITYPGWYRA